MKNSILLSILGLILVAACKKDKNSTPSANVLQGTTGTVIVGNLSFTNNLNVRVTIDIYDSSADYYVRFHQSQPKLRLTANPNTTVVLPKDSFQQNHKYYYDWYTDDLAITSMHIYDDSFLVKTTKCERLRDSFFYCLPFIYDSTKAIVQVPVNGKPQTYRRILAQAQSWITGLHNWQAADAYDKQTGQSVWASLGTAQKQEESFYLSQGFTGVHNHKGWILTKMADTTYALFKLYYKLASDVVYATFADKVPALNLASSSLDTMFLSPSNSPYVYKMYIK